MLSLLRASASGLKRLEVVPVVLCGILVLQGIVYLHIPQIGASAAITVQELPTTSDFLESQLPATNVLPVHTQRHRVTNHSQSAIELAIQHPSCSCLSFERDGAPISPDSWWHLETGESCIVGMSVRLPPPAQSTKRSCFIVGRESGSGSLLLNQQLSKRLTVHHDIVVYPGALEIPSGEHPSAILTKELAVTLTAPPGSTLPDPRIEIAEPIRDFVTVRAVRKGPLKTASDDLTKQTFWVTLEFCKLHEFVERLPTNSDLLRQLKIDILLPSSIRGNAQAAKRSVPISMKAVSESLTQVSETPQNPAHKELVSVLVDKKGLK